MLSAIEWKSEAEIAKKTSKLTEEQIRKIVKVRTLQIEKMQDKCEWAKKLGETMAGMKEERTSLEAKKEEIKR